MNCNSVRSLTDEYIDGLLDSEQEEMLKNHLLDCQECSRHIEDIENMLNMMDNINDEELPQGLHERLHQRLRTEIIKQERSERSKWIKWAAAVAAVFVIFISIRHADQIVNDLNKTEQDEPKLSIQGEEEDMILSQGRQHIKTDLVILKVYDLSIVPETLRYVALQNDMAVLEELDDGIVILVENTDQRAVLHDELTRLGNIDDVGQDTSSNHIAIKIVLEE